MKKNKRNVTALFCASGAMAVFFAVLILALKLFDVQTIGPNGSEIGLAALNAAMHDFFGVNMMWYNITDWLGIFAIAVAFSFAVLGVCQLIKRRSLKKVDLDIILLGVFYMAVMVCYVIFEICVVNYRPILMGEELEASFPSSHTMLVVCVMGAAIYQQIKRIKRRTWRIISVIFSAFIIAVTVVGRLLSGVHWFTDILGGVLLSGALIFLYVGACEATKKKQE